MVGTDYPMAMGDSDSVRKIKDLELSAGEHELILGGNAAQALNL